MHSSRPLLMPNQCKAQSAGSEQISDRAQTYNNLFRNNPEHQDRRRHSRASHLAPTSLPLTTHLPHPTRTSEQPPKTRTRYDDTIAMTEVSFARSFLSALDARPIKISADHVEDPKTYPARGPVSRLSLRWTVVCNIADNRLLSMI